MLEIVLDYYDKYFYEFLEFWTPVLMISIGFIVLILETIGGLRAQYGRYNSKNFGLSAPIAWLLQESPAFLVPCFLVFYRKVLFYDQFNRLNTNLILLLYFMLHYFHRFNFYQKNQRIKILLYSVFYFQKRSFIYTARIKSNKRVNFLENGLAFIFCTVNGLQIGHYHTIFSSHSLFKWNFILGIS